MSHRKQYLSLTYRIILGISLWFFLGAQIRGRSVEPASMDLGALKFRSSQAGGQSWVFFVIIFLMLVAIGGAIAYAIHRSKVRDRERMQKVATDKANIQLDMLLSRLHLSDDSKRLLADIVGGPHPGLVIPLVESNHKFESEVSRFKVENKDNHIFGNIFKLRKQLAFEFSNRSVDFIRTQMLAPETKLECQIPHPTKKIQFVSPILDVTETRILLKPPVVRSKVANLKHFPYLVCKVRRHSDAEYLFKLKIVNQISGKLNAIVLGHTGEIKKLYMRAYERVTVHIPSAFDVISQSQFGNSADLSPDTESELKVFGYIADMSVGGLKIVSDRISKDVHKGDAVVFHLQGANLRENLVGHILNVSYTKKSGFINVQFIHLSDLTRTKINRFLFNMKKEQRKILEQRRKEREKTKEGTAQKEKEESQPTTETVEAPATPSPPATPTLEQEEAKSKAKQQLDILARSGN